MKRSSFISSLLALVATPLLAFQQKEPAEWVKNYAKGPKRLKWAIREWSVLTDTPAGMTIGGYHPDEFYARERVHRAVDQHIRESTTQEMIGGEMRTVYRLEIDVLADEKHSDMLRKIIDANGNLVFTE